MKKGTEGLRRVGEAEKAAGPIEEANGGKGVGLEAEKDGLDEVRL
jgi:hypothetical protein